MLDTDICSYVMKRSSPKLIDRLKRVPNTEICVSVVTKAELLHGVRVSPEPDRDAQAVDAFLTYVEALELGEVAAVDYAEIRANLRQKGQMIGANDLFIAAHARSLDLVLVTNNTEEFSRVEGLALENWTE
jgi:tRNA(fMet)-specific endonuclease VapC